MADDSNAEADAIKARAKARTKAKNTINEKARNLLSSIKETLPGAIGQFYLYEPSKNRAGTYTLDNDFTVGLSPEGMASLTEHNSDMVSWVNRAATTDATPESVQITLNKATHFVCNQFLQAAMRKVYATALKALAPPKVFHKKEGMLFLQGEMPQSGFIHT